MIPSFIKSALWSYDTNEIDLNKNKRLIIQQVLNFGTKEATDWLFGQYGKKEIARAASSIPKSAWDKKSLALWSLIFDIHPKERLR